VINDVAEFMDGLQRAWRAADIETYIAAFDEHADMVNRAGQRYRGRETIAERLRELTRPALFAADRRTESIRVISPTVAVVHELWLEPDRTARATYVLALCDEGWRITLATTVVVQS
jgi:uncharacterized protein (TIGR02246 family)